ncbi:flavin monoamine oxidase family protein [Aspergillus ibericus CBS 121593]|uniref:Amine oxidase n=1 Tax=Aspergillus ibericus CBS 121593 TaxID=1448316 RepID=A0A395H9W9_9EURO|nr:putative flavin-containing amine oxidase [Aspergillus ibericus CBS 121593]RAL03698.1 putative flavin-containing amine oxidase [Aspergillus ibericus CBS 121593]
MLSLETVDYQHIYRRKIKQSQEGFHWTTKYGFQYGLPTAAIVPSTPKPDLSPTYDVIIIGAGFAGLTAARDLSFRGKKTLLIEARDRIGGRCWTVPTGPDTQVEMGGTWVHWQQPHVFSELQQYGMDEFEETVAGGEDCEVVFFDVDGQGGRSVIPFPFNLEASVKQNAEYLDVDKLSIEDRVAQLDGLTQEEKAMLKAHLASFYGVPLEKTSFMEVLRVHALCNFDPGMMEPATMKYKLAEGTTAFALAILEEYKGDRIFGSPVSSIKQSDGEFPVSVTLKNGDRYSSEAVISTVPINVISSIVFDPPLSALRQEAFSSGVTPARTDKLLVYTPTKLNNGLNIACEGDMPYASSFTDGIHGNHTLLTLLAHPDISLDRSDENIRLVETLRPAGVTVDSAYGHLWSDDPYAGGVMPVRGPGFLEKYHEEIRKPHGRVYFCGSDFADGWRGFISGAFEDAYRVTREVLKAC